MHRSIAMNVRSRLHQIVEGTSTPGARLFDWCVIALIVYSVITLTIETLPDLDATLMRFLWYSEIVITLVFTAEYLLRIYTAQSRKDYIFSFYGFVDIVAIAPFYITLILGLGGIDLRAARSFRLMRILRLLKIGRYTRAMARFQRAFQIIREELVLYIFVTMILLYVSATGIYYFENPVQPEAFESIIHSMWWALVTLTTLGYGDVYPVTLGGRMFTFFVLMVGLGVVAIPAGLIASALTQVRREELVQAQARAEAGPRDKPQDQSAHKPQA